MAYNATRVQPAESGPAMNRYLVVDALLACRESLGNAELFHANMEWVQGICRPQLDKHRKTWEEALDKAFRDPQTGEKLAAGEPMPKMARYELVGALMDILHKTGMFAYQEKKPEDATSFLTENMNRRQAEVAAE